MVNIIKKISLFKYLFSSSFDLQKKKFKFSETRNILAKIHNDNAIVGIPI